MYTRIKHKPFRLLNETGASKMAIFGIILTVIILITGIITIYFQYFNKVEFSEEEIAAASKLAQSELAQAFTVTESYKFEDRLEGIQSIGYAEPKIENSTTIFEKHDPKSDYYILLKLQPHDTYANLSNVLVSIFDKENGSLITSLENVLTWKTNEVQ